MSDALESQFHQSMLEIYRTAKREAGYNATRFLRMVSEHGGLETARILVNSDTVSDGYTALWERGRLDLSVEAMVLANEAYHQLFSEAQLEVCRQRLKEYGFMK